MSSCEDLRSDLSWYLTKQPQLQHLSWRERLGISDDLFEEYMFSFLISSKTELPKVFQLVSEMVMVIPASLENTQKGWCRYANTYVCGSALLLGICCL